MAIVSSEQLHATTVAIDGRGVVLEGRSGAGKSDLALRLIDRGALLVADDITLLQREGDRLVASVPATIAGRIEVRGVGIVAMPEAGRTPVALFVRLTDTVERMPEVDGRRVAGVPIREVAINPREPSAPIKIELALRMAP